MRKKTYWKKLTLLVYKLCRYYNKWNNLLPADIPPAVATAMTALEVACAALIAYDRAHPGGYFNGN